MALPLRDTKHHTYAEYCTWPDDARYELIDGIAYAMAPAPARSHQDVLLEIAFQVRTALEGHRCRAYITPFDVRLPRGDEADDDVDTVVQPDLSVVCDRDKLDARGCRGAPDWIVEVLSPATAGHDMIVKRRLYERAGVREYWLVHPTDRVVTVYALRDGAYGVPAIHELKERLAVTVLPEIEIDWARALADIE
ncbi:MAG TPA: Uma2 family endonuclease [Rhodocyclaceae bacterium]|nr:Uma2 family endonuclease [Rhodocyclaceae bacterium]